MEILSVFCGSSVLHWSCKSSSVSLAVRLHGRSVRFKTKKQTCAAQIELLRLSGPLRHLAVPLPVGDCVFSLSWLLPCYFLFAVTYDVLQTLADVAHYLHLYSHGLEAHVHNLTENFTAANLSVLL